LIDLHVRFLGNGRDITFNAPARAEIAEPPPPMATAFSFAKYARQ